MRSVRFEMRLSPEEAATLDALRGSTSRADWLRRSLREAADQPPAEDLPAPVAVKHEADSDRPHRHRRATVVRTWFEGGVKTQVWACDCGHELA